MRSLFGGMAVLLGFVSVTITARYGFKLADTEIDGAIAAVMFGAIALCAFVFDAAAVRLWFIGHRIVAVFIGAIAACALVVTFSNSLGAIVSRSDATMAERARVLDARKDDRTTLARLTRERDAITATSASAEAVKAARDAAAAAERTRRAECGDGDPAQRGSNCRARELDEQATRDKLTAVLSAKAATDRAQELDAHIAAVRARLDRGEAVATPNPLGAALEAMLGAAAATLTAWQSAVIAAVFELCLVGVMVAFEALGHARPATATQRGAPEVMPPASPVVAGSDHAPVGSVPLMMAELLEPARGSRVELEDAYRAYAGACSSRAKRAVPPERFVEQLRAFCRSCGIRTGHHGELIYLTGVELAGATRRLAPKQELEGIGT